MPVLLSSVVVGAGSSVEGSVSETSSAQSGRLATFDIAAGVRKRCSDSQECMCCLTMSCIMVVEMICRVCEV